MVHPYFIRPNKNKSNSLPKLEIQSNYSPNEWSRHKTTLYAPYLWEQIFQTVIQATHVY